MNIKVLLEAVGRPWYIEPQAAAHYASVVQQLFDREAITAFADEPLELSYAVNAKTERIGTVAEANSEGVAVINMRGPVMKYDFCGSPGTQSMIKAIEQANANPAIKGILLNIDSPGGAVDGSYQLHDSIKSSGKPVGVFANGKMCSAAMLFGSAASFRMASSVADLFGSIGTMMQWKDTSKADAAQGIENHEVYATNSTNKNIGFRELKEKGTYDAIKAEILDPTNDEFTNAIQANLPDVDKSVLSGGVYLAKDAKKKGLINSIGTFNDAVKGVLKLSKQKETKMQNSNAQFANVLAASKAETVYEGETFFGLTEEGLLAVEAKLGESATALATANEQLSAAATTATEQTQQITDLQAQIEQLKNADATRSTDPPAGADSFNTADPNAKYMTSVDIEAAKRKSLIKK